MDFSNMIFFCPSPILINKVYLTTLAVQVRMFFLCVRASRRGRRAFRCIFSVSASALPSKDAAPIPDASCCCHVRPSALKPSRPLSVIVPCVRSGADSASFRYGKPPINASVFLLFFMFCDIFVVFGAWKRPLNAPFFVKNGAFKVFLPENRPCKLLNCSV